MPDSDIITVQIVVASYPLTVAAQTSPQAVAVAVENSPQPVQVIVSQGAPGEPGAPGPAGANAEHVILTLAEYLALPPEAQMDGTWYLIPKT
jgi:hypothetical protein